LGDTVLGLRCACLGYGLLAGNPLADAAASYKTSSNQQKPGRPGVGVFTNLAVGVNTNGWGKPQLGITPTFFARFRRSIQLVRQGDVLQVA